MSALLIANRAVRCDEAGRYCVNDLHKAAGAEPRHRPAYWLALDQTRALIDEIEKAGNPAISTKQRVGTFVARELVYSFAMWISAGFHLAVIRGFDAAVHGQQAPDMSAVLRDPQTLRALLADQVDERLRLELQVAEQAPRVAAFDRLAGARGVVSITASAKALNLPPTALFAWLKDSGWIYRSGDHGGWLAYQRRLDSGHMRHRSVTVERSDGTPRLVEQPLVTAKGLARLAELLEREIDQQQAPRNAAHPLARQEPS